ncbi:hypothetical protein J5N97_012919 [Dioscorea zingiberensis]|uniref:Uncharacterized protein n=1 Tax=Dioscorea zingiberensis TaxID=325984 RepID=A0A9D5HI68_9LILI|nr:hypothetical protein J5N97_012919 [Dioscorea zingiberensis]
MGRETTPRWPIHYSFPLSGISSADSGERTFEGTALHHGIRTLVAGSLAYGQGGGGGPMGDGAEPTHGLALGGELPRLRLLEARRGTRKHTFHLTLAKGEPPLPWNDRRLTGTMPSNISTMMGEDTRVVEPHQAPHQPPASRRDKGKALMADLHSTPASFYGGRPTGIIIGERQACRNPSQPATKIQILDRRKHGEQGFRWNQSAAALRWRWATGLGGRWVEQKRFGPRSPAGEDGTKQKGHRSERKRWPARLALDPSLVLGADRVHGEDRMERLD